MTINTYNLIVRHVKWIIDLAKTLDYIPNGGNDSYVFTQNVPESTWNIIHNLGFHPNITVIDSAENTMYGSISYITTDQVILTFSAAFSGTAYLS